MRGTHREQVLFLMAQRYWNWKQITTVSYNKHDKYLLCPMVISINWNTRVSALSWLPQDRQFLHSGTVFPKDKKCFSNSTFMLKKGHTIKTRHITTLKTEVYESSYSLESLRDADRNGIPLQLVCHNVPPKTSPASASSWGTAPSPSSSPSWTQAGAQAAPRASERTLPVHSHPYASRHDVPGSHHREEGQNLGPYHSPASDKALPR